MEDRLKKIDSFFEGLSTEEFDGLLERNGVNEIKPCSSDGYKLGIGSDKKRFIGERN